MAVGRILAPPRFRQRNHEPRTGVALPDGVLNPDAAAVKVRQSLHDSQTDSASSHRSGKMVRKPTL